MHMRCAKRIGKVAIACALAAATLAVPPALAKPPVLDVEGMTFVDPQQSWDHMLMASEPLVVPGDPLCSELFVRLASEDPAVRMPPGSGSGLADGALCSIGTWIAEGATYQQP